MEEMRMKKTILAFVCLLAFVLAGCMSTPQVGEIMSLEKAVAGAAAAVEAKTQKGDAVAVVKITAPLPVLSDFLRNELDKRLNAGAKLIVLAREQALEIVNTEHQFQMSGMVSDESAVGIGHYLGAGAVITGDFTRFANFSQLYIRAVDVRTAQMFATYSAKITNGDPALVSMTKTLGPAKRADVNDSALEHLNKGRDLLAAGIPDIAIKEFNRAIAKDRNFAEAYRYRGNAYSDKNDYDRAIADYTQAIRLDTNSAPAYNNRGATYSDKGDYDRAITDYTEAIRLDPNYAHAYNNRGNAYSDKGDYDRAITDYNQAIRLDPNYTYAYNNRGNAYSDKGDYDRAIADYTQALRLEPNSADAYYNQGNAYYRKGDYDRAIADYNQAIRLNPNDADAYTNRGDAYRAKGDYDRAIADYNQAIRLNPNNTNAYTNRGVAYYNKGNRARARADWKKALALDPNNATARNNLEATK
jgi:tetratricopeptide (TPR) repeat protein